MDAMNGRFSCVEEVVRDGEGLAALIKVICDCFDIILVGRYHAESLLTEGSTSGVSVLKWVSSVTCWRRRIMGLW